MIWSCFPRVKKGLQKALNGLNFFCNDWKLEVNTEKTKVVVFNKSGKITQTNLKINNRKVEDVKQYKYLGIFFSNNGKFNYAKEDLLQRGLKAMFKLTSMFKSAKPSILTSLHLFDHVVKLMLLYGSEIWGDSYFANIASIPNTLKNDIIEKCHLKFCRFILAVNKKSPQYRNIWRHWKISYFYKWGRNFCEEILMTAQMHFYQVHTQNK